MLICFLLFACQSKGPAKSAKVIITLFDLSESTARTDIRSAYISGFKKIVNSLAEGDVLIGACITDKSIQQMELPVVLECPIFKPTTDNPILRQGEYEEFQKKANLIKEESLKKIEELLLGDGGRPKILKTDIMSSLVLASNILRRYHNKRNILVVFSDMIEDSESYNFESVNLTDRRIQDILAKEKKEGKLPDLKGIHVYATGAQARTLEKYNTIKKFWCEYFKETGAELVEYTSTFLGLKE